METHTAIDTLSALAQPSRLNLFRWLVRRYPEQVAAGEIGRQLGLAPATLSFHLAALERAGLIRHRREGRSRLYQARLDRMNALMAYLFEDCCQGNPSACPEGLLSELRGQCATSKPSGNDQE